MRKTSASLPIAIFLLSQTLIGQIPVLEDFVVIKNETAINSDNLEYSPAFFKDGLVFISTKVAAPQYQITDKNIDKNIMSIFRARRSNEGLLEKPDVFGVELLSAYHQGPLTFDRTNETMYFTRNNTDKEKLEIRKLKIYSAELVGENWDNFRELPFNGDDFDSAHPSISVDNDKLYFASNREGGMGGMDLWVSARNGDNWGEPVNLGPAINTAQNEVFPFIHADGTLYFASNGRGGVGQLDIFYAAPDGENWSEPVNLGKPFNSEFDDFGLIVDRDNKNGYFSSNRKGGLGEDDIYNFYIYGEGGLFAAADKKKPVGKSADVAVNVIDPETGQLLSDAKISVINLDDITLGEALAADGQQGVLKLTPAGDGTYKLDLAQSGAVIQPDKAGNVRVPTGNAIVKIEKEGYQPQYIPVTEEMLKGGLIVNLEKAVDCVAFHASVYNEGSKTLQAGVTVVITDMTDKKQVTLVSDGTGSVDYCLRCNHTYTVMASRNGQIADVTTIVTQPCSKSTKLNAVLYIKPGSGATAFPIVDGSVIQLPNIYFNFNDAALRPDAKKDLDAVAAMLEIFPDMTIELGSHTDARGATRYNLSLSQERSNNALQYLISKGIDGNRVKPVGYGESDLRNRCVDGVKCNEAEHQENRRTEVTIIRSGVGDASPVATAAPQPAASETPVVNQSPFKGARFESDSDEETTEDNLTRFLVIAGTFSKPENASARAEALRSLGYQVEIYQFNNSPNQSICVGKYDVDTDARAVAEQLRKEHSIESYVLREVN